MPLVKVKKFNQVTIPKKLGNELGIREGDYILLEREGDRLYIEPVAITKKDLASLWREHAKDMETVKLSPQGEKMVAEALSDIEQGRFKEFDNVDDLINDLKK
jgi:AbrB family looped-hinge helix DNA binding protein